MKLPFFASLALMLVATTARAEPAPTVVALGHDTYSLTREAGTGFTRNTDKLKEQALEDAAAYCAKLHKELKVISTDTHHPLVPLTGFAYAKVVFKALDANDPELHAAVSPAPMPGMLPPSSATSTVTPSAPPPSSQLESLYNDIIRLDDLRKRGLITDEEFQTLKKKAMEKVN